GPYKESYAIFSGKGAKEIYLDYLRIGRDHLVRGQVTLKINIAIQMVRNGKTVALIKGDDILPRFGRFQNNMRNISLAGSVAQGVQNHFTNVLPAPCFFDGHADDFGVLGGTRKQCAAANDFALVTRDEKD